MSGRERQIEIRKYGIVKKGKEVKLDAMKAKRGRKWLSVVIWKENEIEIGSEFSHGDKER